MLTTLQSKKLAQNNVMHCPLCGMPQEGFVNGMVLNMEKNVYEINREKWYAFCNCRNIFFTDWANMNQSVYNEEYQNKYYSIEAEMRTASYAKDTLKAIPIKSGTFLEIGVVTDTVLDEAEKIGFDTIGLDINDKTKSKHLIVVGNAEDDSSDFSGLSVVWASHVFEHFKEPIKMIKKINSWLIEGGCVYIAMPDPWMIPWDNANLWAHWHYKEHHTLWDMDSLIDTFEENGFELVDAKRVAPRTEYRIILRKVK